MVGADGQLKSVSGILSFDVLEVERQSGIVDDHVQLLSSCVELVDELPNRLQRRQIQLREHTSLLMTAAEATVSLSSPSLAHQFSIIWPSENAVVRLSIAVIIAFMTLTQLHVQSSTL